MVSMNDAIRDYTARGWSIIPIRPGDKRPLVRWEDFQHRHANEAEALGWYRARPEAGVGIVTGAISGLVVVDIDVRHGGDGALEQLEREHERLPVTVECRTGGGGRLYYNPQTGERQMKEPGEVVLVTNPDGHVTWLVCETDGSWYRMSGITTYGTTIKMQH